VFNNFVVRLNFGLDFARSIFFGILTGLLEEFIRFLFELLPNRVFLGNNLARIFQQFQIEVDLVLRLRRQVASGLSCYEIYTRVVYFSNHFRFWLRLVFGEVKLEDK